MPEETPSPHRDRPATHRKAPSRPRRYGFLVGWIALTTGTIVASSLALQAALKADRDHRPTHAPPQALRLPQSATVSPGAAASPSESPSRRVLTGPPRKAPASPPPASRRAAPARPKVTIVSPGEQARVPGEQGVLLSGTASGLGHLTLHIFDLADNGSYYPGSLAPVTVHGGHWSFRKRPIGQGSADVGRTFTMIAALGDDACRAALRSPPVNPEGDYAFGALPAGCREMDSVHVVKAAP